MRTEWILPCAGLGSGLAVLLVFAGCWLALRRRRLRIRWSAGEWMNALGFALLPALAVFKAFEPYMGIGSVGKAVFDPLPLLPWATENGAFMPGRIELVLFLLAFLTVCLWLMIRRNDLGSRGDLLGVSMTLWAGIRTVTEGFRTDSQLSFGEWRAVYLLAFAAALLWMILWTGRRQKRIKNTSQTVIYWLVWILCTGALWTTISGTLSVGSEIGDLAVVVGCSAARTGVALAAGADSRKG